MFASQGLNWGSCGYHWGSFGTSWEPNDHSRLPQGTCDTKGTSGQGPKGDGLVVQMYTKVSKNANNAYHKLVYKEGACKIDTR